MLLPLCVGGTVFAAGGTSTIATKGSPASVSPNWPKGVDRIVNDGSRTSGWNSWFSEWPNDVNHYAFDATFSTIEANLLQIRLSKEAEPSVLGWVTRLPKENGVSVIFSIGDQSRIDSWYKNLRQPFGVMEFTAAPEAIPPTLTIFVQHNAIKLNELKIPSAIRVEKGNVPTLFHKSNRKSNPKQAEEKQAKQIPQKQQLDPSSKAAAANIERFLERRRIQESDAS